MSRRLLQKLVTRDCRHYSREGLFAQADQVGAYTVISCIDPKYSAWKYFLPLGSRKRILIFETGFGIDTLAVAAWGDTVITVCADKKYAALVRERIDADLPENNVLVIVAQIWAIPFPCDTFDLIIARDSADNMGEKTGWASCRQYLSEQKKLLTRQGIALTGTASCNLWEMQSCFTQRNRAGNGFQFSLVMAILLFNNKEIFYCSTRHYLFDEIILQRKSYQRNSTFNSLKDCIKETIIRFLFPVGAASCNYIVKKSKADKIPASLFDRIIADFPSSLRDKSAVIIRRVFIGNPCTILCLVSAGTKSYFLRIPMDRMAAVRVEQQFLTLHSLSKTFLKNHRIPEVYPCYSVDNQPVYIEQALEGVVVEDKKFIRKFHEDMAVDWLIRLHKETRTETIGHIRQMKDIVRQTFTELVERIRNESDAMLLTGIQQKILENYNRIITNTVCMHGDFKIENMIFSTDMKKINGVFDWDLSRAHGLPVVDLYYFIVYSAFIRNPSITISELFCKKFIGGSLDDHEQQWLDSYNRAMDIDPDQQIFFMVLAWLTHIVHRTGQFQFSNTTYYTTCVHTGLKTIADAL